ncbi:MAG: hypothetical protein Phog2KO_14750 [Phototrophicaceae bacterium]
MRYLRYSLVLLTIFIAGSMILLAHGDDNHDDETPEESSVTLDFIPTYYEHVKPILVDNCMACHSEGQIAGDIALSDEIVIDSYEDIAYLTGIRYMPPWMPSQDSLPMHHNRSLTAYEFAVIQAWAEAEAPVGEVADYVEPQATYNLTEVRADQVLQTDEAYQPEADVDDDYRCFSFSPNIDEPVYLTGYEFLPDVAEQVHHGIIYLVDGSAESQIEARNYQDGRIGWSCYTGTGINSRGEEFLGTWTPGTLPLTFPEGTGYWIEPDDIFIVQIHYNLLIQNEPDHTSVNLQYESGERDLQELLTFELQAPVEIPCPAGVTGEQCERDVAIQRAVDLYGEFWLGFRPDGLLDECDQTIDDYADNTGEDATTFCDYAVPTPLTVLGVYGHMHELGHSFQLELNPDSDESLMVLDIPAWDFHWQDRYQLIDPLQLQAGDSIRMTCTWDNTLSDNPRYVVWGEGTEDEMCFATIMLVVP